MDSYPSIGIVILTIFVGLAFIAFLSLKMSPSKQADEEIESKEEVFQQEQTAPKKKRNKPKSSKSRSQTAASKNKPSRKEKKCDSPLLHSELKGHKSAVTSVAFSPNGCYVATASEDRSILITFRDSIGQHGVQPSQWRLNVEFDHASALRFSDNSKRLIAGTASSKKLLFYGIPIGSAVNKGPKPKLIKEFETGHTDAISHILLLDVEKWMVVVTCAGDDDTTIRFWNPKGEELDSVNPNQITNHMIAASPDGRFVAAACYTPDVKLFEVNRLTSGEFKKVSKAMTLQHGHTKAVTGVDFNQSSSRVVTCSKDGTWAVWDITVRYNVAEDPRLLFKSSPTLNCPFSAVTFCSVSGSSHVMLSTKNTLIIHPENSDEVYDTIPNSHDSSAQDVTHLVRSLDASFVVSICEQDRQARVWGPF